MDIAIVETSDGGDFVLKKVEDETGVFYDIDLDGGLSAAMYLSHFGGNVEASTTGNEKPGDLRKDYWGNALMPDDPDAQANSGLERALLKLPISSGNLLQFEDKAKADLDWMLKQGIAASIENEAIIIAPESVEVTDRVNESTTDTDFEANWQFEKNKALEEA